MVVSVVLFFPFPQAAFLCLFATQYGHQPDVDLASVIFRAATEAAHAALEARWRTALHAGFTVTGKP
jgi:hypothetical protein